MTTNRDRKPKKSDLQVHDLVEGKDALKMNLEEADDFNETEREDAVVFNTGLAIYRHI